jgi:hypothetical protein
MTCMPPQEIRKFIGRTPFMPFRLHVSDGSSYDVMEPLGVYVDMLHVEVGVAHDEATGLYRESVWIAPNHVTRIEPLTGERAKSTGNN